MRKYGYKRLMVTMPLILALVVGLVISSVGTRGVVAKEQQRYVLITFLAGNEYWIHTLDGMKDAANLFGVKVEGPMGPVEWDARKETTFLDQVIATGPDGIVITVADPKTCNRSIDKAIDMGIPVINFDLRAEGTKAPYIGSSFEEVGRVAVRRLAERLGGKGTFVCTGVLQAGSQRKRLTGIEEILENYPDMKLLNVYHDNSQPGLTHKMVVQALQAHPDLRGIIVLHGQGAAAAAAGVKAAVKVPNKDVVIIGMDFGTSTLDAIRRGEVDSTVAQNPYQMGFMGLALAYLWRNKVADSTYEGNWLPAFFGGTTLIERTIETGSFLITKENIDRFTTKMAEKRKEYGF